MFTGPLEDRVAIQELNGTYADGVVRIDADTWASVWAEDAHWSLMGMEVEGRTAIVELWKGAMSGLTAVSFHCIPCMIEIDGDRAKAREVGTIALHAEVALRHDPRAPSARRLRVGELFAEVTQVIVREANDLGAPEAGLIGLLEPVLTPVWVYFVHGERPASATLIGGAFLLLGLLCRFLPASSFNERVRSGPDCG